MVGAKFQMVTLCRLINRHYSFYKLINIITMIKYQDYKICGIKKLQPKGGNLCDLQCTVEYINDAKIKVKIK